VWFDSWSGVWRVFLVGAVAYVTLVVVLGVSGKRTLAKLNAFDLVTRWRATRSVVTARPTLVVRDGELLAAALIRERLTVAEVRQAVRAAGHGDLSPGFGRRARDRRDAKRHRCRQARGRLGAHRRPRRRRTHRLSRGDAVAGASDGW